MRKNRSAAQNERVGPFRKRDARHVPRRRNSTARDASLSVDAETPDRDHAGLTEQASNANIWPGNSVVKFHIPESADVATPSGVAWSAASNPTPETVCAHENTPHEMFYARIAETSVMMEEEPYTRKVSLCISGSPSA